MNFDFDVEARVLAGIYQFAVQKPDRARDELLTGVYMEARNGAVLFSASTGSIFGAYRHSVPGLKVPGGIWRGNIPGELVAQVKVSKKMPGMYVFVSDKLVRLCSAEWDVEGEFLPPYPGIPLSWLPQTVSGEAAQFDLELLNRIGKAEKILTGRAKSAFTLAHNGEHNGALIDMGIGDFTGLIMPWRAEFSRDTPPDWVEDMLKPVVEPETQEQSAEKITRSRSAEPVCSPEIRCAEPALALF